MLHKQVTGDPSETSTVEESSLSLSFLELLVQDIINIEKQSSNKKNLNFFDIKVSFKLIKWVDNCKL